MCLNGHDGEVLHSRDVRQRKGVPENDVGVVHVVAAAGKVLETLGFAVGLVGVLSRSEQLPILVRGDPDVVLGEGRAFGDDAVSPGQPHLARVGHQLVRDWAHGDGVDDVWVGLYYQSPSVYCDAHDLENPSTQGIGVGVAGLLEGRLLNPEADAVLVIRSQTAGLDIFLDNGVVVTVDCRICPRSA